MMAILKNEPPTVEGYIKHRTYTAAFKKFVASCLKTESKARMAASELKNHPFIDKPMKYPEFAEFLQLTGSAKKNPYMRNFDEHARPKSRMEKKQVSKKDSWNFTADAEVQEEIAKAAAKLEEEEEQRAPVTPGPANVQKKKPGKSSGGASPDDGPTLAQTSSKSKRIKENCIIS